MDHCCDRMRLAVEEKCDQHPNRYDCPDCLVDFDSGEYRLIAHDGTGAAEIIQYCPWCGASLERSGYSGQGGC